MSSHLHRRFGGKVAALAVGAALALTPAVATAAPATPSFGTAPLATPASSTSGPVAGFEDNAARAVYWLAESNGTESFDLWSALSFVGAGYGEAVRDDVLAWAKTDGLAATSAIAHKGQLAQIIGAYGEDPATFLDVDLEVELRAAVASGKNKSIYVLPFIMWGLLYTDDGIPAEAVDQLRSSQCMDESNPNFGSFSWMACGAYDMDGTAWAVQALIAAGVPTDDSAVVAAAEFLRSNQLENGGFENDIMGNIVANTNTGGVVVQALRAVGDDVNANRGAAYIASLQAGWNPAGTVPIGLIAYDEAGYEQFLEGFAGSNAPMATIQAMLAFSGQSFADLTADGSISELPVIPLKFPTPYGPTTNEDALLVAHWLQSELEDSNGLMSNFGAPDWGITLDTLISLAGMGTGTEAAAVALDRFEADGEAYLDYGLSSVAKAAYTLLVYGEDPRTFFDGRDLLQELRDGLENDGALGEYADAFGQAFALLTFERTTEGVPAESVSWLEAQQCLEEGNFNYGGYGMPWGDMTICDSVDADTTSLVVQALDAAGVDDDAESIAAGLDWLVANLNSQGVIEAWGAASANSTSWAAQAFSVFGLDQADGAVKFLNGQVIKPSEIDDSDVLVKADAGLIPASPVDRAEALADGTEGILAGARYATAQAGFGLGGHGLAAVTAVGASAAAPAPEFAPVEDPNTDDGKKKGNSNTNSNKKKSQAADAKSFNPKYAG